MVVELPHRAPEESVIAPGESAAPPEESVAPPEDGVIDDARNRQRRDRRAGAALLAGAAIAAGLILGLTGGGGGANGGRHLRGGGASPPTATHGSSQAVATLTGRVGFATQFGLLAPRVGWGVLANGFYITRDGGHRWLGLSVNTRHGDRYGTRTVPGFALTGDITANIGPSSSPSRRVLAISFIDGPAAPSCQPPRYPATGAGAIVLTADAGRSWSTHVLPHCDVASALSFLSAERGFAELGGPGGARQSRQLYRTTDGATSWQRVGQLPVYGPIAFANPRDGLDGGWYLGGGRVDSAAVYRTADGGRSWTRTSLCRPATGKACEAPVMFSSGRAVVPVVVTDPGIGRAHLVIYSSADDGVHWSAHAVPGATIMNAPEYVPFSAPSARDLIAWVSPYIYRSTDGGVSWRRFAQPRLAALPNPQMSEIGFASAGYGWIGLVGDFDYTTDGGRTWTPIGTR